MSDKDFDNLEERTAEVAGIEKPKPAGEFLEEYYKTLGDGSKKFLGIKTGLDGLDNKTLGLDGLIVLGGIAGQGKTSLALQLAFDACELGTPTIFYSLEMPRQAIFTKILNRLAEVRYTDILLKGGQYLSGAEQEPSNATDFYKSLTKDQIDNLQEAKGKLVETSKKFYIRSLEQEQADITFESVEREINLIKAEHNNADKVLVVIDQLQDFDLEAKEYKDQIDKEGKLIRGFRKINERTGATFLLISHKNKAEWNRSEMTSIKGSVDIVYKPDIVMILESEKEKEQDDIIADYSQTALKKIDLKIVKNRYNAPSRIGLDFNGEYSSFKERTGG